jgi:hypothetical protein
MLVGTTERTNYQDSHQGQFPRRSHLPRRAVKGELQHPTADYRFAAVQVSIEGFRKLLQCLNGWDGVTVFNSRNVTTQKPRPLLDVSL